MREEVGVRSHSQHRERNQAKTRDPQVKPPPRLHNVRAHGRIHEARIQRHAGHHRHRVLRVHP